MCAATQRAAFAQVPIAHLRDAPQLRLAARKKFCLGVSPRKAANLRAGHGETGGILNGRRHCRGGDRAEHRECSSAGAPALHPAAQALRWCKLEPRNRFVEIPQLHHQPAPAPRNSTSNGTVSSQASISSASSRACRGPCAAITPTSVKWPRKPFSNAFAERPASPAPCDAHQRRLGEPLARSAQAALGKHEAVKRRYYRWIEMQAF